MFLTRPPEPPQEQPEDLSFPPADLLSDEPPLESDLHLQQMVLLLDCLHWWWRDRTDFYAAGNLTVYFSPRQRKSEDFRGPDFFVVLGTERKPRKSWVVWHEGGLYPHVIVEILSQSTAETDRGLKKEIYRQVFRTPDYFWFEPETLEFAGFHLVEGQYEPLEPTAEGWLWSRQLELYLGIYERKLRLFSAEGQLVPTEAAAERQQRELAQQQAEQERQQKELAQQQAQQAQQQAQQERQQRELAQQQAEEAQQRAEALAAQLRALGVEPDRP